MASHPDPIRGAQLFYRSIEASNERGMPVNSIPTDPRIPNPFDQARKERLKSLGRTAGNHSPNQTR